MQPITASLNKRAIEIPPATFFTPPPRDPLFHTVPYVKNEMLGIYGLEEHADVTTNFRLYNLEELITDSRLTARLRPYAAVLRLHLNSELKQLKELSAISAYIRDYANVAEHLESINHLKSLYSVVFGTLDERTIDGLVITVHNMLDKMLTFMLDSKQSYWRNVHISFKDITQLEEVQVLNAARQRVGGGLYRSTMPDAEMSKLPYALAFRDTVKGDIVFTGETLPIKDPQGRNINLVGNLHPDEIPSTYMHELSHIALNTDDTFEDFFRFSGEFTERKTFVHRLRELRERCIYHLSEVAAGRAEGELPLLMGRNKGFGAQSQEPKEVIDDLKQFFHVQEYNPLHDESFTSLVARSDEAAISVLMRDAEISCQAFYLLYDTLAESIFTMHEFLKETYPHYLDF